MESRRFRRLIVPGRFQPPHLGHVKMIKFALDLAEELIVVVGSAQESFTIENPLTAGERVELLDKLFKAELGKDYCRRISIAPVMDINTNKLWVQYLRMLLPPFEGVVSGNQLVQLLFKDAGLKVIEPPMYNREVCSGRIIRRMILEGSPRWSECIPGIIVEDLEKIGFRDRLLRLAGP